MGGRAQEGGGWMGAGRGSRLCHIARQAGPALWLRWASHSSPGACCRGSYGGFTSCLPSEDGGRADGEREGSVLSDPCLGGSRQTGLSPVLSKTSRPTPHAAPEAKLPLFFSALHFSVFILC